MYTHNSYSTRDFFIKKDSTLPEIKYEIDYFTMQKYNITSDMLENCAVTFSMIDDKGLYRIANSEAKLEMTKEKPDYPNETLYTLAYKFKRKDTKKAGIYNGELCIDFLGNNCGKIKFPIDGYINIIISDSVTKTDVI